MELKINSKTHGEKILLIDDEDYDKIKNYTWGVKYDKTIDNFYVAAFNKGMSKGDIENIRIHRLIMNAPKDKVVDHINHNTLDNRKENLRLCSHGENQANGKKRSSGKTSKYKGVFKRESGKFRAKIRCKEITTNLGTFENEIDAAKAYNNAALKYFGEFALLNKIEGE